MLPKPPHLAEKYGRQFSDPRIVEAYAHRLPYPAALFELLAGLLPPGPRRVLDLGCGSGDLTLGLAAFVDEVDAVDISAPMLEAARRRPGGAAATIRWIHDHAEEASLRPPYALVTAAESLHWMEWGVLLPKLATMLAPRAVLAICDRVATPPWESELAPLLGRYSTNREFRPIVLVDELTVRGLFTALGSRETEPVPVSRPVDSYIEHIHSGNGFSRDRMSPEAAIAFDTQVRSILERFASDGAVTYPTFARVTWGLPHGPPARGD